MDQAPTTKGCTCFRVRKLARAVSRLHDQQLAATGLKTSQFSMLRTIAHEAKTIQNLAAALGMERTTLTRNLRPLSTAGWIAVVPGPDARQRIVSITPAGRTMIDHARDAWRAAQRQIEETLGEETVLQLHAQVDLVMAKLTPLLEEV